MYSFEAVNSDQLKVIQTTEGAIIVSAGPGTGKTRTLVHRIGSLLEEKKIPGQSILAVTFTRSAAVELKERINRVCTGSRVYKEAAKVNVETFHSLALKILKDEGYPFGHHTSFSLITEDDQIKLVKDLVSKQEQKKFFDALRKTKQNLQPLPYGPQQTYQSRMRAEHKLDFDDLLWELSQLFNNCPELVEKYKQQFRYIMVDEFQDTSYAQYEIIKKISSNNICVIGDPDQAIYGFTGDSFDPFQEFQSDRPLCQIYRLKENYRSKGTIVDAAGQVIHKNSISIPRELVTKLEAGFPLDVQNHLSEKQEAELVVKKIEDLMGGTSHFTIDSDWAVREQDTYNYGLGDVAILVRFHSQIKGIEQALNKAGLPYRTYGKSHESQGELEDYCNSDQGAPTPLTIKGDEIQIMTIHRAKGLEFPLVFVLGCDDGILPYYKGDIDEERRLFYVALTRAKNRIFLSSSNRALLFGQKLEQKKSPFIDDIEETLKVTRTSAPKTKKKIKKEVQPTLFDFS